MVTNKYGKSAANKATGVAKKATKKATALSKVPSKAKAYGLRGTMPSTRKLGR
jgi:hypothetical protein